jgi:hypothetical protein
LHGITLHCIALHYIALYYITLYYIIVAVGCAKRNEANERGAENNAPLFAMVPFPYSLK